MTLDSLNINKYVKCVILLLTLLICCGGCAKQKNDNDVATYIYAQVDEKVFEEDYCTVYRNFNGTYLYEIYSAEGNIICREIVYREPTITLYDSRYVEVQWGAGTGVWINVYYDLCTYFISPMLECARYVGDGVVGIVVDEEERKLYLFNPFSYSDYRQNVELDFNVEMANSADCIIDINHSGDNIIEIVYWNKKGERSMAKISITDVTK